MSRKASKAAKPLSERDILKMEIAKEMGIGAPLIADSISVRYPL